ncbi:hypothetical protein [Kamptonema formosum]|jgi:hypothetical protein|nr:hypothetical protein [Oscillatoria sp. PCC 10802]
MGELSPAFGVTSSPKALHRKDFRRLAPVPAGKVWGAELAPSHVQDVPAR